MNEFTAIIHGKGWTVAEAIILWGIDYSTYNRRCNSERMHAQLKCMCDGLESKLCQK